MTVSDQQFSDHANIVREEFKNRQVLLRGDGPPTNLKAPVGSFYYDNLNKDRYEKVDVGDNDWDIFTVNATTETWLYVNTDVTASVGQRLLIDTTDLSSPYLPITVLMPATPSQGDTIWFSDYASNFGTNNLILDGNGLNIMSSSTDFEVNVSDVMFMTMYINSTVGWKIISLSD